MPSDRVLFVTSNGAGMGHITRCMAIGRRLPEPLKPMLLTLSQALPVAISQGFFGEYFPSRSALPVDDGHELWHQRLAERITEVLETYDPRVVVFDGVFPYEGVIINMWRSPQRAFVWCRRPLWRAEEGHTQLIFSPAFHLVLEPGDFAEDYDQGLTVARRHEAFRVAPVLLFDEDDLVDREAAERELGLAPGRLNVLVSLGAGNINDIDPLLRACLSTLQADERVQVATAQSAIARLDHDLTGGMVALQRYPLAPYLRAFDAAIVASGYNSLHEVVCARVPSLQVPNHETGLDDQVTRARATARRGAALVWEPESAQSLEDTVRELLDDDVRARMRRALDSTSMGNGAHAAAARIAQLAEEVR